MVDFLKLFLFGASAVPLPGLGGGGRGAWTEGGTFDHSVCRDPLGRRPQDCSLVHSACIGLAV